jgi:hypothetical protein
MKASIAITLIIVGALLILAPAALDYLHQRQVADLLVQNGADSATLLGVVSQLYSFGCWLTGSVMIGLAVRFSIGSKRQVSQAIPTERAA